MSGKNEFPVTFNWQSNNPITNFLPLPANQTGSVPSGVVAGSMSGTNIIYSQIVRHSTMDNIGLEITWSGNPSGALQVLVSNSGIYFYPLSLCLTGLQPAGTSGGYVLSLNEIPFRWLLLQYTNASGSGSLFIYGEFKSLSA